MSSVMKKRYTTAYSRLILGAVLAIVLTIPVGRAAAQESVWIGGTSSWFTTTAWQPNIVPSFLRAAVISNGGTAQISLGAMAEAYSLTLGQLPGQTGTLQVGTLSFGPGSLDVGLDLIVGNFGSGTLVISNGGDVINDASQFNVSPIIGDQTGSIGNVTVTGSGSTWEMYGSLSVGRLGTGTLTISNGGTVSLFNGSPVSINTLSTLNIGAGGTAGVLQAGSIVNNGVFNFNHSDTVSIIAPISGNGQITKINGAGTTVLTNTSAFTGTFSVQGGMMVLQGNVNASSYIASNGGTLRFPSNTLNLGPGLVSIQAAAGGTIEYFSTTVRGGFLRGPGTHTILPGVLTTTFNAVTTYNSTNLVQNGSASFLNFTNGGSLTNNAPLSFSGGINASTGTMIVNNSLSTYDVGNNGVVTVNSGGAIDNYVGNLVNGGGSRTTINSGGVINLLSGTTLDLNGAMLVNNGTISGTVNVHYGSLAKGSGSYDTVNVSDGGTFSPGNSPGEVNVGSMNLSQGGRLIIEIRDFAGTAGVDYDVINVLGDLIFSAGTTPNSKFVIEIVTLDSANQPGMAANFDFTQPLSLSLFNVGGVISGYSEDSIALDLSGFENDLGGGSFEFDPATSTLEFQFQPPPLAGDYNNDGTVNAADYTLWRDTLGSTTNLAANGNGNTVIDIGDYGVWKQNFGAPSGAASSSTAAVPEPATFVLVSIAIGLIARFRFGRTK